jgi:hypothetical protein
MSKSPKLYFHDTGLAAWLVGLRSSQDCWQTRRPDNGSHHGLALIITCRFY